MVTLYGDGLWRGNETVRVYIYRNTDLKLCDYSEYGMYAASRTRECRNLGDMQLRKALIIADNDDRVSWYGTGMTENGELGGDFSRAKKRPGYCGDTATVAELLEVLSE